MSIQKVTPAQQIKDKPYSKQAIQLKKQQSGGIEFAKILAEQFKGVLK